MNKSCVELVQEVVRRADAARQATGQDVAVVVDDDLLRDMRQALKELPQPGSASWPDLAVDVLIRGRGGPEADLIRREWAKLYNFRADVEVEAA